MEDSQEKPDEKKQITKFDTELRIAKIMEWYHSDPRISNSDLVKKSQDEFGICQASCYNIVRRAKMQIYDDYRSKSPLEHMLDTLRHIDDIIKNGDNTSRCKAIKMRMDLLGIRAPIARVNMTIKREEDRIQQAITPHDSIIDIMGDPVLRNKLLRDAITPETHETD